MKLIVGLGNPGPRYETTRHNAGFLAVDRLADVWGAPPMQSKFNAEFTQVKRGGEPLVLLKPQTFMNLSGRSVAACAQFFKIKPEDILVIHDELDLKPLTFRLKSGGGAGGHNGLKSCDESLGSNAYARLRIGVGHPAGLGLRMEPADYVLQNFSDQELVDLDLLLDQVAKACDLFAEGDLRKAMNLFNGSGKE